jgi:hypothetical protein
MTYKEAWELSNPKNYELAVAENWLDEWEKASEHVRIADLDFSAGTITSVNEYNN